VSLPDRRQRRHARERGVARDTVPQLCQDIGDVEADVAIVAVAC
jgi:hypothetical protein